MSRSTIGLLCFYYLVAALLFGTFEAWQDPLWTASGASIGETIGKGISIFLLAGIVPVIGWAIVHFRAERATVPFVLWAVIGCAMAYFSHVGNRVDREQKVVAMMPNGVFSGKDRVDFLRSAKLSCGQKQRENPLTGKIGLSEQKIVAYCDCFAEGMAEAMSVDELRVMMTTGKQPSSFVEKMTTMGNFCSQQILFPK